MEGVNTFNQKKLKKYKPLLRLLCVNLNKAAKLWCYDWLIKMKLI
jgi:hypothetical protein